jgi:hypothetical protein
MRIKLTLLLLLADLSFAGWEHLLRIAIPEPMRLSRLSK